MANKNEQRAPKNLTGTDKPAVNKPVIDSEEGSTVVETVKQTTNVTNQITEKTGDVGGDVVEPSKPDLPAEPEYNTETVLRLFRFEDGRANDVAFRLASYLEAIRTATTVEELEWQVHYIEDILSLLNAVPVPEFTKTVIGLCEFIDYDVSMFGAKSSMYQSRGFKPFMGATPKEAIFLEMLRQAAPSVTRSSVADILSRAPALSEIFPARGALFVEALKQHPTK